VKQLHVSKSRDVLYSVSHMDLELQGRRAIVFGSTSGLGRGIAESLASEGARVAVTGRRGDIATEVASSLDGAVAVAGDITQAGEAGRVVEEAAALLGGLDICVVNTGGGKPGGMLSVSSEDESAAYESMRPRRSSALAGKR
jgi:3-oxoacyl-[acyl-carrier protein] reductase